MAGTLFVVATPIGHLGDITLRALEVLRQVSVVAAEDTRRTGNLLRHFKISTRVISLHQHNERSRTQELLALLNQGDAVALVTDAGTPGISDPGAALVRRARSEGVPVTAVPGPSAVTAAVSIAGLTDVPFSFMGFPPIRSKDRKQWFERFARWRKDMAIVCFEAPHRIRKTLADLEILVKQPIYVFRELTKLHEQALVGLPNDLLDALVAPRGEFVIVIPRQEVEENKDFGSDTQSLRVQVGQLTETEGLSKRQAARIVARRIGLSSRDVYEAAKG